MLKNSILFFLFFLFGFNIYCQRYWQQAVDYKMTVNMDVNTFQYEGKQSLVYTNNSPDTINKVFSVRNIKAI